MSSTLETEREQWGFHAAFSYPSDERLTHVRVPTTLIATGPRSSLFALVAAALEDQTIDRLELRGSLGSLKEIVEKKL